jgi:TolB-like protein/Tfp pilus assembly protein PilF
MITRQLAAIMFADIAGYTAVMQKDEKIALQLRSKFTNKLEEVVAGFNGHILDFRGDGGMCRFSSTIESIRAALTLQLAMQEEPKVPLRIGIHSGDVVVDGNNIYGDGVNLASRIETFALPGSILFSAKVYDDIKNQSDIQAISLGLVRPKNVKDAIEIFAASNPGIVVPDKNFLSGKGERVGQDKTSERSILVLPFINISNDPEQEYFSDGLTEEIITDLSLLKNVRVVSRTTSMQYKGTQKDLKTIGKETGAKYVLEGSVRKAGSNLRITAQFIDAVNDLHLWAETYRGVIDDIFDIQEMVSEKIAGALRIQLTKEEQAILQKRYTDNTEAYELYLKGRSFWKKRNEESFQTAIDHFEKALEKDPGYALAWAGLADTYSIMGEYTNVSRRIVFPKQMAAINKALQLDNRLGEAHISLAISLMLNAWDWQASEREFKLGLELNPNYATGHHWYGEWLLFTGYTDEAFREINTAMDLEPTSPGIVKDRGVFHYYLKQYEEAMEMGMLALEFDEGFVPAHRLLSLAYTGLGMFDKALSENERWGEQTGNKVKAAIARAEIYACADQKEEAVRLLRGVEAGQVFSANDYRGMALAYMALGEQDNALAWLEKSLYNHEESLCSLKIDKKWDPVRSDERFQSLLKALGLQNAV